MEKREAFSEEQKRNEHLLKMIQRERERTACYEELAKVHGAYIAILIRKLGATEEKPAIIQAKEVAEALGNTEVRVVSYEDGSWGLYCENIEKSAEESDCGGVQKEAEATSGSKTN